MRYLLIVALALAAIGLGWFFLAGSQAPESGAVEIGRAESTPAEAPLAAELDSVQSTTEDDRTEVAPAAMDAAPAALSAVGVDGGHPFAGAFAGVTGRVIEADGAPVPGLTVTLLQVSSEAIFESAHVALPLDSIEIGDALTDAEGRFTIEGALGSGIHGLGVDLGGVRATVRFIDESLVYREVRDVGDIELPEFGTVFGIVIDDEGDPVEGARVRLAAMPDLVAQSGILELREESVLATDEGAEVAVVDPPQWLSRIVDRLPVSTAYTNGDGEFRMEGVPSGRVSGGVDQLGSTATQIAGFDLQAGEEYDLDELELVVGRTVSGRVVDAAGEPVAGVAVHAGAMQPLLDMGFLQPAPVSDADGQFTATGISELGRVVVAARRTPSDPWMKSVTDRAQSGVVLRLPSVAGVILKLVDSETGEPLEGAVVTANAKGAREGYGLSALFDRARRSPVGFKTAKALGEGSYSLDALPLGRWGITGKVPAYGTLEEEIEHDGVETEHLCEVKRGEMRHLRLVDAVTDEPVSGAHVSVIMANGPDVGAVASGWSDGGGLVAVGPLTSPDPSEGGVSMQLYFAQRWIIQHPQYGRVALTEASLASAGSPGTPIEVRLAAPVEVSGRVTWAGKAPGERYMLVFTEGDNQMAFMPRYAVTDAEGFYSMKGLVAGSYTIELMARFTSRDPMEFLPKIGRDSSIYREALTVLPGAEDPVVDIDLKADGEARKGWIEGTVRLNDAPVVGAQVELQDGSDRVYFTDSSGQFRTDEIKPSQVFVEIQDLEFVGRDGKTVRRRLSRSRQMVSSGKATVLDWDGYSSEVSVQVLSDDDSLPIQGATVSGEKGESARTDEKGIASLALIQETLPAGKPGAPAARLPMRLTITADGYAKLEFTPERNKAGTPEPSEARLSRSVPCAGTIVRPTNMSEYERQTDFLHVDSLESEQQVDRWVQFQTSTLEFEIEDLAAGRYRATYGGSFNNGPRVEFELSSAGDANLVLDFSGE